MKGAKTGGRTKGTPNKATRQVKAFLAGVFDEAFADPQFKQRLVQAIVTLAIDSKTLQLLLAYHAGAPPRQVEHSGAVQVSLAKVVSGQLDDLVEDDEELDE